MITESIILGLWITTAATWNSNTATSGIAFVFTVMSFAASIAAYFI
ncbi:MAG: hypothetical protein ACRCWQ_02200 [Bacilli bacterium]